MLLHLTGLDSLQGDWTGFQGSVGSQGFWTVALGIDIVSHPLYSFVYCNTQEYSRFKGGVQRLDFLLGEVAMGRCIVRDRNICRPLCKGYCKGTRGEAWRHLGATVFLMRNGGGLDSGLHPDA